MSTSPAGPPALPPVDFQTLIISLASSALMQMDALPGPSDDTSPVDLPMAKHTIDTLAMLQEKTKGNLSSAEAELLEGLVFDLRCKYIEASRKPSL